MTYKEAALIFEGIESVEGNLPEDGNEVEEALILAKKALRSMNEPMRPVLKSGESLIHRNNGNKPHEWTLNKWQDWCCPRCGWFVGQRYNAIRNGSNPHPHDQRKSKFCNECGQEIDWSKGEE